MNKALKLILFAGFFPGVMITACAVYVVPSPTAVITPTVSPTATQTAIPAEIIPAVSATPEFAPFCDPAASDASSVPACRALDAQQSSTFCQDKNAYNLILFDKGLTYQVLTEGFRCTDGGAKGDKQMITCTGQFAANFAINICDPGCAIPTVQSEITQCPLGYNYNYGQGCCTDEIQEINPNCKAFTFTTSNCVVNCFEYHKKSKCKKHYDACIWNDVEEVCELRK